MDQERRLSGSDYDIVGVPFVDKPYAAESVLHQSWY